MPYYLSIDCGTTNVKAAVLDESGRMIQKSSKKTPFRESSDHRILTEELYQTVCSAVRDCTNNANFDIARINVTGHGNGLYYQTSDGSYGAVSPMNPHPVSPTECFDITLQSRWSGQPLEILAYLKREEVELYGRIRRVMCCKDYIIHRMTGAHTTDYTDASAAALLDYRTNGYSGELLKRYGIGEKQDALPQLLRCTDIAGALTGEAAAKCGLSPGIPVLAGIFDANASMLGTGTGQNDYSVIAGTWGINAVITGRPVGSREITQSCVYTLPDDYMMIDSAPVSCVNLEILLRNVFPELDFRDADEMVHTSPPEAELVFFPFLYPPMDIPAAEAGFSGIQPNHKKAQFVRAVFEGIVFEHRRRIEKFRRLGFAYDSAILSGGASSSPVWCQMFADILGVTVKTCVTDQAGLLGCAVISAVSHGMYSGIEEAQGHMTQLSATYIPHPNEIYERKYDRYLEGLAKWTMA